MRSARCYRIITLVVWLIGSACGQDPHSAQYALSGADDAGGSSPSDMGADADADGRMVCGIAVGEPVQSPCASGELLGSVSIHRNGGAFGPETVDVDLPSDYDTCIHVANGRDVGKSEVCHLTSAGEHTLLVAPEDVVEHLAHGDSPGRCQNEPPNGKDTILTVTIDAGRQTTLPLPWRSNDTLVTSLMAGPHEITVTGSASHGPPIVVEVRGTPQVTGGLVVGEAGILELTAIDVDRIVFSPDGDGIDDTISFSATATPTSLPGAGDGVDFEVRWSIAVVSERTCEIDDERLSGTEDVNSPVPIAIAWDGTDIFENPLRNGTYLVQLKAELLRITSTGEEVIDVAVSSPREIIVAGTQQDFGLCRDADYRWPLDTVLPGESLLRAPGRVDVDSTVQVLGAEAIAQLMFQNDFQAPSRDAQRLAITLSQEANNPPTRGVVATLDDGDGAQAAGLQASGTREIDGEVFMVPLDPRLSPDGAHVEFEEFYIVVAHLSGSVDANSAVVGRSAQFVTDGTSYNGSLHPPCCSVPGGQKPVCGSPQPGQGPFCPQELASCPDWFDRVDGLLDVADLAQPISFGSAFVLDQDVCSPTGLGWRKQNGEPAVAAYAFPARADLGPNPFPLPFPDSPFGRGRICSVCARIGPAADCAPTPVTETDPSFSGIIPQDICAGTPSDRPLHCQQIYPGSRDTITSLSSATIS